MRLGSTIKRKMTSTSSKPFHTYENVVYDDQISSPFVAQTTAIATSSIHSGTNISTSSSAKTTTTTIESPFTDPMHDQTSVPSPSSAGTKIFSATDSSGTTRMLTSKAVPGQNLVTKLISLPSQSPMDSFKEWSVSTFKCTKQIINEKRGICSITNDAQLQADIDNLREERNKLVQLLKAAQQMNNHYTQLVKTQRQLYGIMNEMCIKCFTNFSGNSNYANNFHSKQSGSKQIVANFSSLSNNLSSTTTTSPTHPSLQPDSSDCLNSMRPILNHIKSSNVSIAEDLKKNAMALNSTIKNGEKLVTALTFFCSNISTLTNKTIEDTLIAVKQFESARLEYDAERNSLNFISPSAQTSINYSSDKLELARARYEQLKENVQIKMRFLEENVVKVVHKQMLLFNGAFASYSNGNTAALEATLRQFNVK